MAMRALIADAAARRERARARSSAMGFGDLLVAARDALRDHREIAAKAVQGVDVLLVDEFQDTSRVQRDIVYLLRESDAARSVRTLGSVPSGADLEPQGLLLVGDRKQ